MDFLRFHSTLFYFHFLINEHFHLNMFRKHLLWDESDCAFRERVFFSSLIFKGNEGIFSDLMYGGQIGFFKVMAAVAASVIFFFFFFLNCLILIARSLFSLIFSSQSIYLLQFHSTVGWMINNRVWLVVVASLSLCVSQKNLWFLPELTREYTVYLQIVLLQ